MRTIPVLAVLSAFAIVGLAAQAEARISSNRISANTLTTNASETGAFSTVTAVELPSLTAAR